MKPPGCVKAWDDFLEEHPSCGDVSPMMDRAPAGTAGLANYSIAPSLAWSGWRYRIPGGPIGGQYHGFIAPDDTVDGVGWPAGHDETFRPIDDAAGLGAFPWQGWDETWGGIPLREGETVSDYVYRGPAELRPRPNASGGVHTVRAAQTQRSAGYAVAPGNYRGIGAVQRDPLYFPPGTHPSPCPAWGCYGPPPWLGWTVRQPPPPTAPGPAPTVAGGCPTGQYQDAAGNCTSDWHNPYSLYLPESPAPAPTVAANTCPTGYSVDANGNCVPAGSTSGVGISSWLSASTQIAGVNIPNVALAGAAALLAFKMFGGKR